MKNVKFILELLFIITVVSCSCNISENKRMLDLMLTQPDSIWVNIENDKIKVNPLLLEKNKKNIDDLIRYINDYFRRDFDVIYDDCYSFSDVPHAELHEIKIRSKTDSTIIIILSFSKIKDNIWRYNGMKSSEY